MLLRQPSQVQRAFSPGLRSRFTIVCPLGHFGMGAEPATGRSKGSGDIFKLHFAQKSQLHPEVLHWKKKLPAEPPEMLERQPSQLQRGFSPGLSIRFTILCPLGQLGKNFSKSAELGNLKIPHL